MRRAWGPGASRTAGIAGLLLAQIKMASNQWRLDRGRRSEWMCTIGGDGNVNSRRGEHCFRQKLGRSRPAIIHDSSTKDTLRKDLDYRPFRFINYRAWQQPAYPQKYCHSKQYSFNINTKFALRPCSFDHVPSSNTLTDLGDGKVESWSRVSIALSGHGSTYRPPSTPEEIPEALK